MPTENVEIKFKLGTIDNDALQRRLDEAIANGELFIGKIDLEGEETRPPFAFTLDKRKYRLRFTDETSESVKVWIEPVDG